MSATTTANVQRIEKAVAGIRTRALERAADLKAMEPRFKTLQTKLAASMKGSDRRLLMLHQQALKAEARKASMLLSQAVKQQQELEAVLAEDDGMVDDLASLEKLSALLSGVRTGATRVFTGAKKLDAEVDRALEQMEKTMNFSRDNWAFIDARFRKALEQRKEQVACMAQLRKRADAAVAARDAKALEALQKENAKPFGAVIPLDELRNGMKQNRSLVDAKDLDADLRAEFEEDMEAWAGVIEQIAACEAQVARETEAIAALRLAAPDARKAATLLGIAGGDVARLAKALEAEPAQRLKALEALRAALKIEMPAKQMLATLQRARIV